MKKTLLVIDMLNDFINEKGSLYIGKAPKLISNISERIKEHRDNGNPIIYIMDKHLENDEEFNMFPSHCIAGEWGSEVVPELAPKKGDYLIGKRRYSAFFGTDLDRTLRELDIKEIELTGVCTNICLLYTAADARMLNYDVVLHKECASSFDMEAHNFALKEMDKTLGVKVI